MSAWIVTKNHIDAIVTGAITVGIIDSTATAELDTLGEILWKTNYDSVNARYNDQQPYPAEYKFEMRYIEPVSLIKQIHCYEYQSCEHDAWEGSAAYTMCEQIQAGLLHLLPGYADAPWGLR